MLRGEIQRALWTNSRINFDDRTANRWPIGAVVRWQRWRYWPWQMHRRFPSPESRYFRVKAILELRPATARRITVGWAVSGSCLSTRSGSAKVFGVRLIAPGRTGTCCGDGESRSSGSGLIRALRGAPPFDGNRFPPFMWDGAGSRRPISISSPNGSTTAARLTTGRHAARHYDPRSDGRR